MHICIVTVAVLHLCTILHPLRATTSICANFLSILQENPTFSILYTYFYKTLISVYLFYHLFYLNNHFLTFFLYYFIPNSLSPLTRLSPFPLKLFSLKLLSITVTRWSKHQDSPIQAPILTKPQAPIHSLYLCCVSVRGCVWFCGWFFIFVVDFWFCVWFLILCL